MTAVRYEWARLATGRGLWWSGLGTLAVGAATTWAGARELDALPVRAADAAQLVTAGTVGSTTPLAVLVVAFAAVLACAREQRAAALPALLIALPHRTRTLAAKVAVTAFLAVTVACVGVVVNAAVATARFGSGFRELAWDQAPVPRILLGYAAYLGLAACLGLAVGIVTRGSAIAAVGLAVFPLVLEPLAGRAAELTLAEPYRDAVRYLPFHAADRMLSVGDPATGLSPGTGALTFACWTAAALLTAGLVFARREA
jgi:ABC-2 type transport system permease protein